MPCPLLLLFEENQEDIARAFANVLNEACYFARSMQDAASRVEDVLVSLPIHRAGDGSSLNAMERTSIVACPINTFASTGEHLISACDYEFCYDRNEYSSREIARFLGVILGCNDHLNVLRSQLRSTLLSTTFSDIRVALPNMDILSVGVDAVEIRVDLLQDPSLPRDAPAVPGIPFVAQQIMLLRQRTELPIVFNIRCSRWNGRFPMQDPLLCYKYLCKAIQWGCEYIDVELWIPEEIRSDLALRRGSTRIISTWHDYSGKFKWISKDAKEIFDKAAIHGDIVKMVTQTAAHSMETNYELEFFRSTVHSSHPSVLFSGLNVGPLGQRSMIENNVLTPVTHPLLPLEAVQSQMSAGEINSTLHLGGKLPRRLMYVVGSPYFHRQATFIEKVINELSLPHRIVKLPSITRSALTSIVTDAQFGGAFFNPPIIVPESGPISLSDAAQATNHIDMLLMGSSHEDKPAIGHNIYSQGIRATLLKDFMCSAYVGRPAIIVASSQHQGMPAAYALSNMGAHPVFITGFKATGPLGKLTRQLSSLEDPELHRTPFVVVCALSPEKSRAILPLIEFYSDTTNPSCPPSRIYLDLSKSSRASRKIADVATTLGWRAYNSSDVHAFLLRDAIKHMTGFHVGYDFIRLTGGMDMD